MDLRWILLVVLTISFCCSQENSSCHMQTYTVLPTGNDTPTCVENDSKLRTPCQTLLYLLLELSQNMTCVNIIVSHDQIWSNQVITLRSVQNWTIIGSTSLSTPVRIHCSGKSGLAFNDTGHVRIENLHFLGCGVNHVAYGDPDYPLLEHSALYFVLGSDVEIVKCGFHNGTGTGVILDDVAGDVLISGSDFFGNQIPVNNTTTNLTLGGLIVRNSYDQPFSTITVSNCTFKETLNYECHYSNNGKLVGLGGGVTFNLSTSTNVSVIDSNFIGNSACQGGGLHIHQHDSESAVAVRVSGSTFAHNFAIHEGGGVAMHQSGAYPGTLTVFLQNCSFRGNNALYGGGLVAYNNQRKGNITLLAENSTWLGNTASYGGFGVGLSALPIASKKPSNMSNFFITAHFEDCEFVRNTNNGSAFAIGAVHLDGSKAIFTNARFLNNSGTALFIRHFSYVAFSRNCSLTGNRGTTGGAIYVGDFSQVGLMEGWTHFQSNYATMNGGAIYVNYSSSNDECVFESLRKLLGSSKSIRVFFSSNIAGSQNQSIFIENGAGCLASRRDNVTMRDIYLFNSTIFTYLPKIKAQVSSVAETIVLDYSPKRTNNSRSFVEVMPGENFFLLPTVKDLFGNNASQSGNLALVERGQFNSNVKMVGPHFINMDDYTKNNEISIRAEKSEMGRKNDKIYLEFIYTQPFSDHEAIIQIQVKLKNCNPGFTFDEGRQQCVCKSSDINLVCDSSNSYACVRYGYWLGNYTESKTDTLRCPGHNCHFVNGECPLNCPDLPNFCLLNDTDSLCKKGRSGILCSECRSDHSFSFDAVRCSPSGTCSRTKTALLVLGLIGYWIFLVYFFLFFLSVELSVGSGIMYGIMYYFSVVGLFTENTITYSFLRTLIDTCVAVSQLSPSGFGSMDVCFVSDWRLNLQHLLFQYMTPLAVILVIVLVICFSRYCPFLPKSLSPSLNTPIHAMCILILASYASLTTTSFEILKPVKIGDEFRVHADPKLKYFHTEHLPYAMVGLFVEIFILLPVCLLILFAPCLSRKISMGKLRLKLKPFIDEFQACYRPECRWFAGFYFLSRQLLYFVYVIPTGMLPENDVYLHTINLSIVIIHCFFQPYKLKWLNFIDGFLLIDVMFVSFFHLDYVTSFVHNAAVYILILVPSLYFGVLILLLFVKRVYTCSKKCRNSKTTHSRLPPFTQSTVTIEESVKSCTSNDLERSAFFREPLLADSEDSDGGTTSSYNEEDRSSTVTSSSLKLPSILSNKASTT